MTEQSSAAQEEDVVGALLEKEMGQLRYQEKKNDRLDELIEQNGGPPASEKERITFMVDGITPSIMNEFLRFSSKNIQAKDDKIKPLDFQNPEQFVIAKPKVVTLKKKGKPGTSPSKTPATKDATLKTIQESINSRGTSLHNDSPRNQGERSPPDLQIVTSPRTSPREEAVGIGLGTKNQN